MPGRLVLIALAWLFAAARLGAAAEPSTRHDRVDVAPTRTSIYIGTVSMTMPTFQRQAQSFATTYAAKVFPFAFYNEKGSLTVDVTDAQLDQLARGQPIEFTGAAKNTKGELRKVTGKATPADGRSGKLKVRVWVSKRIELIFNTTYRFAE